MKLLITEAETEALRSAVRGQQLTTCELARAELLRAVRRSHAHGWEGPLAKLLARTYLVALDHHLLEAAGRLEPPRLRTLDAIHLASAYLLGDAIDGFIVYDRRLREAASAAGLRTLTPGPLPS